jgi:outer membrane receptor protein involved in Fe transport
MKHITRTFVLSTALAAGLFAQDANDDLPVYELKNIIVRGELWESELQKTTASVSVIDEAALQSNGTQHFEDVINAIPNLTWTGATSRPRYIQIRGIGENSQFEGETPDSTVRFLIDDFDLTGIGTVGNLFDVQQVEVLRGPQAGAFGANAAGGVVKIVSNDPTPYWTGQAEATIGNDDLWALGLALGGPILESDPDQLTFRFSINTLNQNGFRENQSLDRDDTNERDELTSRLRVRWLPNDNWQIEGGLLYADADNGYDEFTLSNEDTDTFSDQPGRDEQETRGGSLRASYLGFDKTDLSYVGQFTNSDSSYAYDSDWGSGELAPAPLTSTYTGDLSIDRERDVSSHELRFDSKDTQDALGFMDRWTVGVFYHELNEDSTISYNEASVAFAYSGNVSAESTYETDTLALFTQAAHDFSKSTRVILGLRFEQHETDFTTVTTNDTLGYIIDPSLQRFSQANDLWGGKITLEHELNNNHMAFASVARGYKSGGANSGTFSFPFDAKTYENETSYNFELGLRSSLADGKVRTQLTFFHLQRKDAQLRDSAGSGGFFRYLTVNGEDARHIGLEAEVTWYIHQDWKLTTTLGLLDTDRGSYITFDSDEDVAPGDDLDDIDEPFAVLIPSRKLANAPGYTYSARLDYQPTKGFFASAEAVGSDNYFESNSHDEKRDAFAVVNATIGYRWDNWALTLWAKNLFDEDYAERVFFFNNTDFSDVDTRYEAPAAPRTFGATLNYSW